MQVPRRLQRLPGLPILVLALCGAALGQQGGQEEEPEPLLLRVYDIRDLLKPREDNYWGGTVAVGLAGKDHWARFQVGGSLEDAIRRERANWPDGVADFVDSIQRAINYETRPKVAAWCYEGGPATIEFLYGGLVITQTARGHERVAALLDAVRKHRLGGPLVTVEARWVLVDEAKAGDFADAPKEITEDVLEKAGARVLYRGRITGFNRQVVHVASGAVSAYMPGAEPVLATQAVALCPPIDTGFSGVVLQVRPILLPGAAEAVLDLDGDISELKTVREKPLPDFGQAGGTGKSMKVTIDCFDVALHRLRTTTRVPLGKPVLIGGLTAPDTAGGKVVYLVVTVSASK